MNKDRVAFNSRISYLERQSLITIDFLKASSLLDFNIDPVKILPYLIEAQELKLEPLIGTALYRKLQQTPRSFEYQTLIDGYVSKTLIHWALEIYLKVAGINVMQGGIYRHLPTDAEPVSRSDIDLMIKTEQYKADEFSKRMIGFLNGYSTYYPEWTECIAGGIAARQRRAILGGWQLKYTTTWSSGQGPRDFMLGCCDPEPCGGGAKTCPDDGTLFDIQFWWGINNIAGMGFDPHSLQEHALTLPEMIEAQPIGSYFWMVSTIPFKIQQLNIDIPLSVFSDTTPESEVYVYGQLSKLYWCRIKIVDTYEQKVEFQLKKV